MTAEVTRDDVLDAFAAEPDTDGDALRRYLLEYPQFAGDLVDLSREIAREMPAPDSALGSDDQALIERAWRRYRSGIDPLAAMTAVQQREVAKTLAIPRQVVIAIKESRVETDSIPLLFLRRFAIAAGSTLEAIAQSLAGNAVVPARAYKSDVKPSGAGKRVSFEQILIEAGVGPDERAAFLRDDE